VAIGKRKMKIYIDESYITKKSHLRVFKQACKFFTDNNGIKGRNVCLIVAVSPFAVEKDGSKIWGAADKVAKGIYFVTLSNKCANGIIRLEKFSLAILFHELEHIRQFHSGVLRYTRDRKNMTWKGVSQKGVHYKNDPAEVAAWAAGDEYANDFLKVFPRKRIKK
jgi:hypothetical protein